MIPQRFTEYLEALRWTDHTLAGALECDLSLVGVWASGEQRHQSVGAGRGFCMS